MPGRAPGGEQDAPHAVGVQLGDLGRGQLVGDQHALALEAERGRADQDPRHLLADIA